MSTDGRQCSSHAVAFSDASQHAWPSGRHVVLSCTCVSSIGFATGHGWICMQAKLKRAPGCVKWMHAQNAKLTNSLSMQCSACACNACECFRRTGASTPQPHSPHSDQCHEVSTFAGWQCPLTSRNTAVLQACCPDVILLWCCYSLQCRAVT